MLERLASGGTSVERGMSMLPRVRLCVCCSPSGAQVVEVLPMPAQVVLAEVGDDAVVNALVTGGELPNRKPLLLGAELPKRLVRGARSRLAV